MATVETVTAWSNQEPATTRVTIAGAEISPADIYENSLKISESICDENALVFVGCIPSACNIKIRGIDASRTGEILRVYTKAGTSEEIQIFEGKIDSVKQDARKEWAEVEAFDALYEIKNLNVSAWYEALAFPLTLEAFRNSFFNYAGVTQEPANLINDSVLIEETIGGEEITGADILEAICQINAVFGTMNRAGAFVYVDLAGASYTLESSQIRSLNYEEYRTGQITGVQIRETADDVGARVGTAGNAYVIEGNFLAYGKPPAELEQMAGLIYNKIAGYNLQYTPASVKINGAPYMKPGDAIEVRKPDGRTFKTFILSHTLAGFVSYTDEIEADGVQRYAQAITSANNSLIQLRGQSNRLTRTVEGLTSTVTTIKKDYASKSELQQTSEQITAQIETIQREIDGSITTYEVDTPPTLQNYPAYDFTYNIICGVTSLTEGLRFEYTEEGYRKNLRALAFDKNTFLSYRFIKQDNTWGWQEIADTEYGVLVQRISTLELTAQEIKGSVKEISEGYATKAQLESSISVSASQILQTVSANFTDKNTTQSLEAQLAMQADEISAKVSTRGGNDRSFGWNLTADAFRLMCNNSEKFRCDQNGVKVNGEIITTSGNIGGWVIQAGSINNGIPYTGEKNSNATGIGGYGGGWAFWAGNGKFSVKQDGSLYAENATINGYATAARVEAIDGKFNNLSADNIKTGTLSVDRLNITAIMLNMAGKALGVSSVTAGDVKVLNALLMNYNTRQIQVYADASGFMKWRYS